MEVEADDVAAGEDEAALNPVGDMEFGVETDIAPTQVMEQEDWTDHQRRQLRSFSKRLEAFAGSGDDQKLYAASIVLDDWISSGFNPVVFCAATSKPPTTWASIWPRCWPRRSRVWTCR